MTENVGQNDLLAELTADVVSAYVSNNPVPAGDLPGLISEVHTALGKTLGAVVEEVQEKPRPAVNPKRSVTDDYIICLEDGQKFKSLKRHLMSHYNMTPEQYREKWGLPADYPMVAPSYAAQRSKLAREMGLGRKRGSKR
ncbi:MucR family transcriptional regulator [Oricola thermophila]|uniref:MucR family transcriptional regulator n=1 Tax=Oricola thermophila TaxID=2742145 RepID=A0A6N1VCA5_9HYPH|nr:MucR family transcriptional regulator [Oricola thermophila]QKV18671.1 MucR family transcriptional regulator [Oricola thermophila]